MDLILQIWGGSFYLTNKICFALAEDKKKSRKRQLKIIGWLLYILGVPAWVTILIIQNKPVLAIQQAVSLCFVVYGFMTAVKVASVKNAH